MNSKTAQLTDALGRDIAGALGDGWTVQWGVPPPDDDGSNKLTTTGLTANLNAPGVGFEAGQVSSVNRRLTVTWTYELFLAVTSVPSPMDAVDVLYTGAEAVVAVLQSSTTAYAVLDFVDYFEEADVIVDQSWQGTYDPPMSIGLGFVVKGRM